MFYKTTNVGQFDYMLLFVQGSFEDARFGQLLVGSVLSQILSSAEFSSVTYQSASPEWLERRSKYRVWLKDIHLYVFCQAYDKRHQFKQNGEFEISFANEEGSVTLKYLL